MKRIIASIIAILSIGFAWWINRSKITRWVVTPVLVGTMAIGAFSTFVVLSPEVPADASSHTYLRTDTFTSTGTWTAPSGVTSVTVEAWGAGGGSLRDVGGGGGGCYVKAVVSVTPSSSYDIFVAGNSAVDTDGGNSTFATTTVVAPGGKSASNGGTTCDTGDIVGDSYFLGGNAGVGTGSRRGGGGAGETEAGQGGGTTGSNIGGRFGGGHSDLFGNARSLGGGGNSSATIDTGGGRGEVRVSYDFPVPAGYPYVTGRQLHRSDSFSATKTISLPSHEAGDLLLLHYVADGNQSSLEIDNGWTNLGLASQGSLTSMVAYKEATSGSETSPTVTLGSFGTRDAGTVFTIKDWETISYATSTGDSPNAQILIDTGSTLPRLWLALAGWDANINVTVDAPPQDNNIGQAFINFIRISSTATNGVLSATAESFSNSSGHNSSFNSINEQWATWVIGITSDITEIPAHKIKGNVNVRSDVIFR